MIPDEDLICNGLLIVTGSCLKAEEQDRPLAYRLSEQIQNALGKQGQTARTIVMGDLWYLNAETLQKLPTISIGAPQVNAVSANLIDRIPNALAIDHTLTIQMDMGLKDLRASIWGTNHEFTKNAIDIFVQRRYMDHFIGAVAARMG